MRLSKASAYAIFACVHVARRQHNGPVQGRLIAEENGIPVEYLLKILQQLVRFQILDSQTGRRGGFRLHLPAAGITLLQIVEAVDGPITGELPVRKDVAAEPALQERLESLFGEIARATQKLLDNATIQDLLDLPRA